MKLIIESTALGARIEVIDEVAPPQRICNVGGKTLSEAARWAVKRVNRIADQVEERLITLGLISEEEIEAILTAMEQDRADGVPSEDDVEKGRKS